MPVSRVNRELTSIISALSSLIVAASLIDKFHDHSQPGHITGIEIQSGATNLGVNLIQRKSQFYPTWIGDDLGAPAANKLKQSRPGFVLKFERFAQSFDDAYDKHVQRSHFEFAR